MITLHQLTKRHRAGDVHHEQHGCNARRGGRADDPETRLCQGRGNGAADAPRGARDQRDLGSAHPSISKAAARLAGRPVRIMLSREGVYRVVGGRAPTEQRVALGAQVDGRLDALVHTGVVAMTSHNKMPEPFILPTQSA